MALSHLTRVLNALISIQMGQLDSESSPRKLAEREDCTADQEEGKSLYKDFPDCRQSHG